MQFIPAGLKAVRDVLEKEQAEDDVFVLGGIDLAAKSVGGFPEGVGVGEVRDVFVGHALGLSGKALMVRSVREAVKMSGVMI